MAEHIPREFIQLLLERIDIIELIDGRVPLRKKSGNNYFACCPFHTEKNPSFSVSHTKQFYHCFGCGAHGNAIDFLMNYDHLSFPEAIHALANQAGLEIPRQSRPLEKSHKGQPDLYQLLMEVAKHYQGELRQHPVAIAYLKQRGISGEIAKEFGLGYAPPGWNHLLQQFGKTAEQRQQLFDVGMIIKKEDGGHYDRFRERIMFPIQDRRGRLIGFGGRILAVGEPKYLNSPETVLYQKGHELYGLYHALKAHRTLKQVVIVEGYMDVIALFQQGITYAVATLGTATTPHHLQRLFRHTAEIIFCFDGDEAGRTAALRALQVTMPLMQDGQQVRFLFLPEGEDPDSLVRKEGREKFVERMQTAQSLTEFLFQEMAKQVDLTTMDGRARYIKLAKQAIDTMPDTILKKMLFEELSKRARVDVAQLHFKPETPQHTPLSIRKPRLPSPLRFAMMLLVQQPELAKSWVEPLPALSLKGYDLFQELFTLAQQGVLTTGLIREIWRDREEGEFLLKFAQMEHMIPAEGIQKEFLGALVKLKKLAHTQLIERLLAKAAQQALSAEEKQELAELINAKN